MNHRKSIYAADLSHKNPIPAACRVGNVLMSGIVGGVDPRTGELPASLDEQCRLMFGHIRNIVEQGGGTLDDIVKITVYLKDHKDRDALNREWLKAFPNADSRPARQAMPGTPNAERLIECDFVAVIAE
jgi:2-iminobutanoate/2-iminopropanoate deaminase